MPQPIKSGGKGTYRRKSCIAVPPRSRRRINIRPQRIVGAQTATHALQVGPGGAARRPQTGNHGELVHRAIAAQLGAEMIPRRQIHRRIHVVGAGITGCHRPLPVLQGQRGAARAIHGVVDVDVVLRVQRERIGAPGHGVIDIDIAQGAAGAAAALNRHIAAAQVAAKGGAGHVAAAGGYREVGRVNQPGAVHPLRPVHAARGLGRDMRRWRHRHLGRTGLNKAPIAAIGRTGVQRAVHRHAAAVHIAQQPDYAAHIGHRAGFNHAAVVHHGAVQRVKGLGRQHHLATVGDDGLLVVHQRLQRALADAVSQQRALVQLQRYLVASG